MRMVKAWDRKRVHAEVLEEEGNCVVSMSLTYNMQKCLDSVFKINASHITVTCPNLCLEKIRINTESNGEGLSSVNPSGKGGTHCRFQLKHGERCSRLGW